MLHPLSIGGDEENRCAPGTSSLRPIATGSALRNRYPRRTFARKTIHRIVFYLANLSEFDSLTTNKKTPIQGVFLLVEMRRIVVPQAQVLCDPLLQAPPCAIGTRAEPLLEKQFTELFFISQTFRSSILLQTIKKTPIQGVFFGGDEENRTPVRKCRKLRLSECSL